MKLSGHLKRLINRLIHVFRIQIVMSQRYEGLKHSDGLYRKVQKISESLDISESGKLVLIKNLEYSFSQLEQDLISLLVTNNLKGGYFVEFGAASGTSGSNTYLLEKKFGWAGILAEPARIYRDDLLASRKCHVDFRCVYSESGQYLDFIESKTTMLSTIAGFEKNDSLSEDRKVRKIYQVETVSLNDLLIHYNAPNKINYISIDTEGSELEIVSKLNFDVYTFDFLSIEHNSQSQEYLIENFMDSKGYKRILRNYSQFDSWFVPNSFSNSAILC